MYRIHNARRKYLVRRNIRDWPVWPSGTCGSSFKRVSRALYSGDQIYELPLELAKIIIAYAQAPRTIYISDDGNCWRCNPEYGEPEWPCDLHDDPQPNPEYRHIRIRDLRIYVICVENTKKLDAEVS